MKTILAVIAIAAGVYFCTPHYDTTQTTTITVKPGDTLHELIYQNHDNIPVESIDLLDSTAITIDKNHITGPLMPGQRITIYINHRTN